jgi:hypothetical protein
MFHLLFECFENMTGNAVNCAFSINHEQPNFPGICPAKIKNPDAATLAGPTAVPANLTNTTGPAHKIAHIRIGCKKYLENPVLVIGQVIMNMFLNSGDSTKMTISQLYGNDV